jgi:hypothetical protein
MSTISVVRRAGTAVVASALAASLVAAGAPAQAAPADHGADWLSRQLTDGLVHNDQFGFDDYGLSIDTAFGLEAIGGHKADVRAVRTALSHHVEDYTGAGTERYAGATAKLLVLVQTTGGDPTSFGGVNLVKRLNQRVTRSGPAKGRIADQSQFGDFSNTIGQVLAVRGLSRAGSGWAGPARRFLLEQQCRQGYFRLNFARMKAAHQSCGKKSPADPDATSYAVVQLWKTSQGHPALRNALKRAAAWLVTQQHRSGAFVGGTSTGTVNTNSTGLAGWALAKARKCTAAESAARWVAGLQVGPQPSGSKLAGQRGAVAYNLAALKAGKRHGINARSQDQWRRATSQAAPALLFRHGC